MHAQWVIADGGGFIVFIILGLIVINVIKHLARSSKQQQPPPRMPPAEKPKDASQPQGSVKSEIDRFLDELARQSGMPVPPRPAPAPQRPAPPPVPKPRVPAPVGKPAPRLAPVAKAREPVPVHHPPAEVAEPAMVPALAVSIESEPVPVMPALAHLSPLAQAVVLREVLGPCRALKPYRPRSG